jgi:structure-specific endonuclease subunit SLX1
LLKSAHEKFKDETYIGFTDNPLKRIRQHNGLIKGGAKKTSKKRPWKLVLVISNFPNKILALKFEWAWQNPFTSKYTSEIVITY